jgi:hypothetical protein
MVRMVVEHLEPSMGEWVVLEYIHMVEVVGKENLLVTNISEADAAFLPEGESHYFLFSLLTSRDHFLTFIDFNCNNGLFKEWSGRVNQSVS